MSKQPATKKTTTTSSAPAAKAVKPKKRSASSVPSGVAHVKATFNNTIIAITDPAGRVIAWSSAGKVNFSGSRKSSAFAATVAAQDAAKVAASVGMKEVEVNLKGPGAGRESAVRGLQSAGLTITAIRDTTPVPHNGCRPRKRRRV
ncbi:MAG: 30S ribosomal protein S11 [Parachlamydiaceae bacterium]|nr:30S ribosomal protein S11 [Parachlamydiaceae bacterium]